MKRNKKRILSAVLVFLTVFLLFALYACGKDDDAGNPGNADAGGDGKTADGDGSGDEPEEIKSAVPDDVKFGGEEIRILNCAYFTDSLAFVHVDGEIGEIVNDAIYKRNLKVQNDLGVNFKFTDMALNDGGGDFLKTVRNSVSAGSDDFDILIGVQYNCVQLVTAGVYANLAGAPYINLENPWWPAKHIQEEMSIGKNNLYFLAGDISLNFIRNMGCAFFNKQMYMDNFGHPDEMYKLVLEDKWTIDKLGEICKTMYRDLNGDGKADNDDQFGAGVITSNLTDHFTYAAGVRVTARDNDGVPYYIMNNERTVSFTEKLYNLFYANEGVRVFASAEDTNNKLIPGKFKNNELLFDFGWFYISELLRDMKTDYGLIPFPKYDESQPTYLSLVHDIAPLYSVPTTCVKTEAAGAVLESLAFESYKTVVPAYYEIALKLKYTRDTDDDAFKIIDMIHANSTTDFAYVYNYTLNNIGLIMREIMGAKSPDFVSRYEKLETKAQVNLENLIETYLEIVD